MSETKLNVKNRKNKQKRFYSGKKKRHTIKTQIVGNNNDKTVICTNFCEGKKHDFRLLKECKVKFHEGTQVLVDTRISGVAEDSSQHRNSKKSTKKNPLIKQQKGNNRYISSRRVLVENVIGSVKRFRMLSERYRNRRTRFGLRFNLISAIHNFELSLVYAANLLLKYLWLFGRAFSARSNLGWRCCTRYIVLFAGMWGVVFALYEVRKVSIQVSKNTKNNYS